MAEIAPCVSMILVGDSHRTVPLLFFAESCASIRAGPKVGFAGRCVHCTPPRYFEMRAPQEKGKA